MSEDRKTLKRGLDALLGDEPISSQQAQSQEIAIDKISPSRYQARENINEESLEELTESISSQGVIQPIIVRRVGGDAYELIAGERRWRASKQAGLTTIPAIFKDASEDQIIRMGLIENLQREDLNPVEEARGLDRLKREFGLTQDEVATSTGKARSTIANALRILSLPNLVLEMLSRGEIEKGHAKLLASMEPKEAEETAKKIVKNKLSIKDLSGITTKRSTSKNIKQTNKDTDILNVERDMSEKFGHKIQIDTKNKKAGKVSIFYKTLDELDSIIQKLKNKQ